MELTPAMHNQILTDWQSAPRGTKNRLLEKWADMLGCTVATLYRQIPAELKTERKQRPRTPKIANMDEYAVVVAQIKRRPPAGKRLITTEDAIALAVEQGLLPEAARDIAPSTFNARMRQLGLRNKPERVSRWQADYPNQLHQIDASGSDCFYVERRLPNGDAVLKLDTRPYKGYKNKPVKTDERDRLWIYGLVDDYSGLQIARYVAAPGESCVDNLDFLAWAWAQIGLCDMLKADHGPLMKNKAALDLIERLSIEIDDSVPGASRTHGKIERPWRTLWQRFETPFFAEDHKSFEITLSELNTRLTHYLEAYNSRPHRYEKRITRKQAWQRVNLRGGIVQLPENAIRTSAKRYERNVEADGCFSLHGERYEVKGLHCAKVYVYEGILDGRLVVKDKADGQKYEVENFRPLSHGQYRQTAQTPDEQATKAAKTIAVPGSDKEHGLRNTLYRKAETAENVIQLPIRTKEKRHVEDILDANAYRSLDEALRDFAAISGLFLDAEVRELVKDQIVTNGLNRTFVRDLALEVRAENEKEVRHG